MLYIKSALIKAIRRPAQYSDYPCRNSNAKLRLFSSEAKFQQILIRPPSDPWPTYTHTSDGVIRRAHASPTDNGLGPKISDPVHFFRVEGHCCRAVEWPLKGRNKTLGPRAFDRLFTSPLFLEGRLHTTPCMNIVWCVYGVLSDFHALFAWWCLDSCLCSCLTAKMKITRLVWSIN